MAAARVDLIPQVEGGGGRLEHDPPLLLQAEAAHTRGGVETACPGQNLPGDGVRGPLVLQLPDVVRESGARLVPVAEIALVPGNPVPHRAVGEAGVRLLGARGEVGHLGSIDDALGHAISWYRALLAAPMAITPASFLHLAAVQQLVVVLLYLLCHVRHGGVGHLHRVPVHHPPQLMVWGETGVLRSRDPNKSGTFSCYLPSLTECCWSPIILTSSILILT